MAMLATERATTTPSRTYPDLHEHIASLRKAGLLIEIDRPINKDTEMHPLVRWQFRGGIPSEDRRAFLFTNVHDSKGRKYDIPVLVCGLAGNNQIYSIGMGCKIEEIRDRWIKAMSAHQTTRDHDALSGDRLRAPICETAKASTQFRSDLPG